MDVDFKAPHQENGAKSEEESSRKTPTPPDETNGTTKESPKHATRQKKGQRRSRSRTPQNKSDDSKTLHVNLKKLDTELNGKDLQEEPEKTEEIKEGTKAQGDQAKKEDSLKEDTSKVEETTPKKEKQTKKQKQESLKKEEQSKKEDIQDNEEAVKPEAVPKKESPKKDKKEKIKKRDSKQTNVEVDSDPVEMDPLVISDEPDPELQFDENSDMESGKGSPVIPRCITRRSQTRNIPTPKTPKSVEQDGEPEKSVVAHTSSESLEHDVPKTESLSDSRDSSDVGNLSTRAEAGSDITRMDYVETHHSNVTEDTSRDTSYLDASRERSLSETLRCLSARRPIRQAEDYRRKVLRNNQDRSDLNLPYPSRRSVEQITTGHKRKSRSTTPEDRKKFKMESPGLNSLFTSPLANFRNKFKSDLPSSTPKLLGYKDNRSELHYHDDDNNFENGDDEKKSWCSVM